MVSTVKACVDTKVAVAKAKLASKLSGDSQLVVALVLIAVAIGLCIIFRNQIYTIMNNLFNTITTAITNMSAGVIDTSTVTPTP